MILQLKTRLFSVLKKRIGDLHWMLLLHLNAICSHSTVDWHYQSLGRSIFAKFEKLEFRRKKHFSWISNQFVQWFCFERNVFERLHRKYISTVFVRLRFSNAHQRQASSSVCLYVLNNDNTLSCSSLSHMHTDTDTPHNQASVCGVFILSTAF